MGAQLALLVPPQLFGGQPAHALDKGALDLTFVKDRVQRPAYIVQNIRPLDPVFAGQSIDGHLGTRGTVSVVIERPTLARVAVPVDFRGFVKPCCRQMDTRQISLADEVCKGDGFAANLHCVGNKTDIPGVGLPTFTGEGDQPFLDLIRRIQRGHPVEVRPR